MRKVLGIGDDQRVVMYAPTFRDYMSADDMAAERIDFFDVDRAARDVGPGYTFLVRGHAFNARAGGRHEGGANILDVTGHPDINDLILASDCAVLDYSSLRFDYALVDKPMIFLVPDLEKYDAVRGGVIPFAPTAPGRTSPRPARSWRWCATCPVSRGVRRPSARRSAATTPTSTTATPPRGSSTRCSRRAATEGWTARVGRHSGSP